MGEGDIEGMPRCSCGGGLKVTTKRIYAGGRDRGIEGILSFYLSGKAPGLARGPGMVLLWGYYYLI